MAIFEFLAPYHHEICSRCDRRMYGSASPDLIAEGDQPMRNTVTGAALCQDCAAFSYGPEASLPHYDACLNVAAALNWPEAFRADLLVHDRHALESQDPTVPFIWAIRSCGTHLVRPSDRNPESHLKGISEMDRNDAFRLFVWEGSGVGLHEVNLDGANAFIANFFGTVR
jgi:hypothetical protein